MLELEEEQRRLRAALNMPSPSPSEGEDGEIVDGLVYTSPSNKQKQMFQQGNTWWT